MANISTKPTSSRLSGTWSRTFLATIPSVGNVLDRRRSIANRQEYADILGIDGSTKTGN
jgi:hypothetical protein